MSAAAAAAEIPEQAPAPKTGKKKLILIGIVVLLVLAIAGGGTVWWLKKRAHAAAVAAEEEGGAKVAEKKIDLAHPPTFLPLDPFVVNLADRDADRYAQIGITLELESPAFAEQVKVFMPAVRNAILMVIAHKSARDLLGRAGKEDLADEIMREALRPMGIEVETPVRIRPVVAMAPTDGAPPMVATLVVPAAPAAQTTMAHDAASAPEAVSMAASVASAPAMAAAPASGTASAAVNVAAAPAMHGDAKPKAHGDAGGPIHHVHFSSFIIQ